MRTIDTSQPLSRAEFLYLRDRNRLPSTGYTLDESDDFSDEEKAYAARATKAAKRREAIQSTFLESQSSAPADLADDLMDDPTAAEEEDAEAEGYEAMNVEDLKEELRSRELKVSGTKDELIERLEQDDADGDDS